MVAMISSSSQFEVAIGTAMVLFGIGSGVALATVTGPLLEIPLMVTAAKFLRRNTARFGRESIVAPLMPSLQGTEPVPATVEIRED